MKRLAILAAAVALTAGPALAQEGKLVLSPDQETHIYTTLHSTATVGAPPADVTVEVGQPLPEAVEIHTIPDTVNIAPVREYRYAVVGPRVVLVEPESRKIVRIIQK